jgi:DNA-binding MarR family transcriptional regulator
VVSVHRNPPGPQLPAPEVAEILASVPLLAAYFRRVSVEMPDDLVALFNAHGLTARHGAVLSQLAVTENLGVTQLARVIGVSLSTASELIGDLSRAGIVERREDPTDRRRTLVQLAQRHRASVEQLVASRAAPLIHVLEGLSDRDRQGFAAGLRAWAAEVRTWPAPTVRDQTS